MAFLLAIAAGVLVVLSMTLNSALGLRIGIFRATAVNYIAGLTGVLVLAAVLGLTPQPDWTSVPWWAWTGGLLGVAIVAASNLVLPRIPVVTAAVLIVLGQLGTGLVLDALKEGVVSPWQVGGALLVLAGSLISQFPNSANSQEKTD